MNCYIFSDDVLNDDELNFISEMLKRKSPRKNSLSKPLFNTSESFTYQSNPKPLTDDDIIKLAINLNISVSGIEKIMKKDYS
jgi:hypothetical protein